eukprot:2374040-Amphidinium_carterae.1
MPWLAAFLAWVWWRLCTCREHRGVDEPAAQEDTHYNTGGTMSSAKRRQAARRAGGRRLISRRLSPTVMNVWRSLLLTDAEECWKRTLTQAHLDDLGRTFEYYDMEAERIVQGSKRHPPPRHGFHLGSHKPRQQQQQQRRVRQQARPCRQRPSVEETNKTCRRHCPRVVEHTFAKMPQAAAADVAAMPPVLPPASALPHCQPHVPEPESDGVATSAPSTPVVASDSARVSHSHGKARARKPMRVADLDEDQQMALRRQALVHRPHALAPFAPSVCTRYDQGWGCLFRAIQSALSWHDLAVLNLRDMMALAQHVPGQLLEVQQAVRILTRCFAEVKATQSSTGEVPIQPGDILCVRSAAYFVLEVQPASIVVADPHRPLLLTYQRMELPWGLTTVISMSKLAPTPARASPSPAIDRPLSGDLVLIRDERTVTIEPLPCVFDGVQIATPDGHPHLDESTTASTAVAQQVGPLLISQSTQTEHAHPVVHEIVAPVRKVPRGLVAHMAANKWRKRVPHLPTVPENKLCVPLSSPSSSANEPTMPVPSHCCFASAAKHRRVKSMVTAPRGQNTQDCAKNM